MPTLAETSSSNGSHDQAAGVQGALERLSPTERSNALRVDPKLAAEMKILLGAMEEEA